MLKRKMEARLASWKETEYGLLIDGARQTGKTYIIRDFLKKNFDNAVEINLIESRNAVRVLSGAVNADDFMLRLSALINKPLVKGAAVFIYEIQVLRDFDIVTLAKFLVEKH